jgi:hypothetical protein
VKTVKKEKPAGLVADAGFEILVVIGGITTKTATSHFSR